MRTIRNLVIICTIIAASSQLQAQNMYKLIIYTQDDVQKLMLKDQTSGKTSNIPTWNKTGSGFLIECENMQNTHLVAKKASVFRVFSLNKKQTTTWITLAEGESISFDQCFQQHLGSTTNTSGDWQGTMQFVVSNYQSNPIYDNAVALRSSGDFSFDQDNRTAFFDKENIHIHWALPSGRIAMVTLRDITQGSNHKVWQSDDFQKNTLAYSDFEIMGRMLILEGHQYQVEVEVENNSPGNENKIYTYAFSMESLVFDQADNPTFFVARDSVDISWKTNQTISSARLIEKTGGKELWSSLQISSNSLTQTLLDAKTIKMEPKTRYQLSLTSSQNQVFDFEFEIMLSDDELKRLVDFMKE